MPLNTWPRGSEPETYSGASTTPSTTPPPHIRRPQNPAPHSPTREPNPPGTGAFFRSHLETQDELPAFRYQLSGGLTDRQIPEVSGYSDFSWDRNVSINEMALLDEAIPPIWGAQQVPTTSPAAAGSPPPLSATPLVSSGSEVSRVTFTGANEIGRLRGFRRWGGNRTVFQSQFAEVDQAAQQLTPRMSDQPSSSSSSSPGTGTTLWSSLLLQPTDWTVPYIVFRPVVIGTWDHRHLPQVVFHEQSVRPARERWIGRLRDPTTQSYIFSHPDDSPNYRPHYLSVDRAIYLCPEFAQHIFVSNQNMSAIESYGSFIGQHAHFARQVDNWLKMHRPLNVEQTLFEREASIVRDARGSREERSNALSSLYGYPGSVRLRLR